MHYMALSKEQDLEKAKVFMEKAGLEVKMDELAEGKYVLLKDHEGELQGMIGLEIHGEYGLLRSFAFLPESQAQIPALFETALAIAKEEGAKQVYLASNKLQALGFFEAMQFEKRKKEELPNALLKIPLVEKGCTIERVFFMSRGL